MENEERTARIRKLLDEGKTAEQAVNILLREAEAAPAADSDWWNAFRSELAKRVEASKDERESRQARLRELAAVPEESEGARRLRLYGR